MMWCDVWCDVKKPQEGIRSPEWTILGDMDPQNNNSSQEWEDNIVKKNVVAIYKLVKNKILII